MGKLMFGWDDNAPCILISSKRKFRGLVLENQGASS